MKKISSFIIVTCLIIPCVVSNASTGTVKQWLTYYGLLGSNTLVIEWQEKSPILKNVYIHGCRLISKDGGTFRDVYFTEEGVLLQDRELETFGICKKDWENIDISFPAHYATATTQQRKKRIIIQPQKDIPTCSLPPIDHALLMKEDNTRGHLEGNSLIRYGVNRSISPPIEIFGNRCDPGILQVGSDGNWQWRMNIKAVDALGMRICFDTVSIPDNVELYVYNPDNPAEYYGPFLSGNTIWTPTIISDTSGVICIGKSKTDLDSLVLKISHIIHVYRSPLLYDKVIGPCHVDIACQPEWEGHATAVGRLGLVDFDAWACTGSLIVAPGYDDNPPFLLTANHCISLQAQATTLEIWWLYQRPACNEEPPPNMTTMPRSTGGATLLAGSSAEGGSDFTLLLLNETVPVETAYLGFTTRAVSLGESVACIHHPQGVEKKISFGVTSGAGSPRLGGHPLTPYEYFHEVLWTEGTTEGGSSGSPLLLAEEGQIIGQLYGGYASCTAPSEPDYFGRMDVTYPLIQPWLDGSYPIEGESEEGEGEGEGEITEGESEGEIVEGEGEGESEGEGEGEGENIEEGEEEESRCLFGMIPCPNTEQGIRAFRYLEITIQTILTILGLLLIRAFFTRNKP